MGGLNDGAFMLQGGTIILVSHTGLGYSTPVVTLGSNRMHWVLLHALSANPRLPSLPLQRLQPVSAVHTSFQRPVCTHAALHSYTASQQALTCSPCHCRSNASSLGLNGTLPASLSGLSELTSL